MVESTALNDFLGLFEAKTPLALLVVKAPAGFVTGALADTYEIRQMIEDGPVREAEGIPSCGRWTSIVQLADDPWSFVVWSAGHVPPEAQAGLGLFAQDLTATLGTEALTLLISVPDFRSSDAVLDGSATGFCVYRDGETVERAVVSAKGRILSFKSEAQDDLEPASSDLEILERKLAELGICLPPGAPDASGDEAWLSVTGLDQDKIHRVDLVEGSLRLPTEEETLDMVLEDGPGGRELVQAGDASAGAGAPTDSDSQATHHAETEDTESEGDPSNDDTRLVIPKSAAEPAPPPGLLARLSSWVGRLFR